MYTPVSLQELDNARQDVESLEKVVNGSENEDVTTRLGETYPTLKKFIKDSGDVVQSSIDAVIDGNMITDELISVGGGETQADKNAEFELTKFDTGITATKKALTSYPRSQKSVNSDIVNIRDFIDAEYIESAESGSIDVYQNIINATQYASDNNKTLVFNNGKVYKSSNNLNFSSRINWTSSGDTMDKPVIDIQATAGIGLSISGGLIVTTSLTSNIAMFSDTITLSNTDGVVAGCLVSIMSNVPWTGTPTLYQNSIKKGHLCLISEVLSDNKVRLVEPINAAYDLSSETVTVEVHKPVDGVSLTNITLKKPKTDSAALVCQMNYCTNIAVNNLRFLGAQAYGFQLRKCYGGTVDNCFGSDAVNYYQFSSSGSNNIMYSRLTANNCAKVFDATGFEIPSRNITVVDSEDYNGGEDATGATFYKLGTGFGTHWGAENVTFINCTTRNRFVGFYQRGLGDKYINCHAHGIFKFAPFQLENPKKVLVLNCNHDCGFGIDKSKNTLAIRPVSSSNYAELPTSFVSVVNTDSTGQCGEFTIKGCKSFGAAQRLVDLRGDGITFKDFEVTDNLFFAVNNSLANDINTLELNGTGSRISNCILERNNLQSNAGQTNMYNLGANATASVKENLTPPSIVESQKSYVLTLDTDTSSVVNAGTRGDGVEITVRIDSNSNYYAKGILYKDGTFSSFGMSNFYARAGALTGITGGSLSEGKIALGTSGSRIWVQNRTGVRATIILKVSSPI